MIFAAAGISLYNTVVSVSVARRIGSFAEYNRRLRRLMGEEFI